MSFFKSWRDAAPGRAREIIRRLCLAGDVRFAGLMLDRIGHQVAEPELFIKEGILGMRQKHRLEILVALPQYVANHHFMGYWKKHLWVVRTPKWCQRLHYLAYDEKLRLPRSHYVEAIDQTAAFPRIQEAWQGRPPLLRVSKDDRAHGQEQLRRWGLGKDDWFVCVHCREGGFIVDPIHDFRNASIANFYAAMQLITSKGGWVIRLGDATMEKMPPMPRVIDYAVSPEKSERLDVFLAGSCRFFLGTSSGMSMLAGVFGVPCACANHAPVSVTLCYTPDDLGIPKRVYSRREQRLLTFTEVLASPIGNYRYQELYDKSELTCLENTPEEILELCREMFARVEGRWSETPEDEKLQQTFKSLFRPGHYSYGSRTRVGRDFLRRNQSLLHPPGATPATSPT
jgi:putative glycosyltransferase (TIGR04372 family)